MSEPGAPHITFHQFQRALYFIAAARRTARQMEAVASGTSPADSGSTGHAASSIAASIVGSSVAGDGGAVPQEYATDADVEELYREVASLSPAWRHAHGMAEAAGHWRGASTTDRGRA